MGAGQDSGTGTGGLLGGTLGMIFSNADRQNAKNSAEAATQELLSVGLPPDLSNPVAIKHLQSVGLYTPQLEQAIDLGITQGEQIKEDPALKVQQLRSLSALEQLSQRGLTPAQQAALQQERMQGEADEQSRQASLIQQMQARGQGGGGAEIAARLQSSQAAANRGSQAGLQAVGQSSQAAQNALQMLGSQAGQVRQQDFGVAKDVASAADLRSRFNTEGAIRRQSTNVDVQNRGQERNLSRAEHIADTNTGWDNNELYRQNNAKRQYWQDMSDRASNRANAYTGRAANQRASAADTGRLWYGIGAGVGGAVGAAADAGSGQPPSSGSKKSVVKKA
jgi:hypothetical protein